MLKRFACALAMFAMAGSGHAAVQACSNGNTHTPYTQLEVDGASWGNPWPWGQVTPVYELTQPLRIIFTGRLNPVSVTDTVGSNETIRFYIKTNGILTQIRGTARVTDRIGRAAFTSQGAPVAGVVGDTISFTPDTPLQAGKTYVFKLAGVLDNENYPPTLLPPGATSNTKGSLGIEGKAVDCVAWPLLEPTTVQLTTGTCNGSASFIPGVYSFPRRGCQYDVAYWNDYINSDAHFYPMRQTVRFGLFNYTFQQPSDEYDFGLVTQMSGIRFNNSTQQWVATSIKVYSYQGGSGSTDNPSSWTLRGNFTNVPVANSTGAFPFSMGIVDGANSPVPFFNQLEGIVTEKP